MSEDRWRFESDELDEDRIEPGTPQLENVLFVLLGVLCTIGIVLHLIGQLL